MKPKKRDNQKALIVKQVALKHGVSTREVYLVLSGDRNNEQILSDYLDLWQLTSNLLLEAVKKAVPFE